MTTEPVAVVGAACRLPGACGPADLWRLLTGTGTAAVRPGDEELLTAGVRAADLADPAYVPVVLSPPGVTTFDAGLFGMTDAEADRCDPVLRLLLETAHDAVTTAGHDPAALAHGTGVVVAAGPRRWAEVHLGRDAGAAMAALRSDPEPAAFVAARLGLRGPALTLTSGSLAAVAVGVRALQAGDCDVVLTGGVHVEIPHGHGYRWTPGGGRPPDGVTRPFDAAAAGAVHAGGAVVLVLKRLDQALADGDDVRAVIRSAVTGHAGDGGGRAATVAEALLLAGDDVPHHVEATGTALPDLDAAEVAALTGGLDLAGHDGTPVRLGAVSSRIGHTGAASGAAGLLTAVLAVGHERLPATLAGIRAHPALRLGDTSLVPATDAVPWEREQPRRVAVHEVTAGGGNTVVVVDEGVRLPALAPDGRPQLVVWSGPDEESTDAVGRALADHLDHLDPADWADTAATLQRGRPAHRVRRAVVAPDPSAAATAVRAAAGSGTTAVTRPDGSHPAVIHAGGSPGTDHPPADLPVALYGVHRAFTEAVDECLEALESAGADVYDAWCSGRTDATTTGALTFAARYGVLAALGSWGVVPAVDDGPAAAAAAVLAGEIALADAAALVVGGLADGAGGVTGSSVVPHEQQADDSVDGQRVDLAAVRTEADLLEVLGRVWVAGVAVDWAAGAEEELRRVPLPGYPYRRDRHWTTPADGPAAPQPVPTRAPADEPSPVDAVGAEPPANTGRPTSTAPSASAAPPSTAPPAGTATPSTSTPSTSPPASTALPTSTSPPASTAPPVSAVPAASAAAAEAVVAEAVVAAGLPPSVEPLRPPGSTAHAFWVLDQLAPGSGVSNIGIAFTTAAPLRWWPLQTAAEHLVRRHPALRQRFPVVDGAPLRHLTAPDAVRVRIRSGTTTAETLVADLQAVLHEPFDLARDLPFRLAHLTMPDGTSVVCLAVHHIVVDAPSVQILVEELGRTYDALGATGKVPPDLAGTAPLLAEPEPDPESLRYWVDALRGADPRSMVLPGSRPVGPHPTFAGHTCSRPMDADALAATRELARTSGTSENVVLTAAFLLTLLRHGAGPDLVVGVPVGTRRAPTAQQVGYGVTTMPLRVRADPDAGFAELVEQVAEAFYAGVEHADVSVERVLTERGLQTEEWRVPLFRHMVNYRPWSDESVRICGEVPGYVEDLFDRSRLDLQLVAVPEPGRFTLRCWHSTEAHDEAEVDAFVTRMQGLLVAAAADPGAAVGTLPFGSAGDTAAWDRLNDVPAAVPGPPTVAERITAAAFAGPAVVEGGAATGGGARTERGAVLQDGAAIEAGTVGEGGGVGDGGTAVSGPELLARARAVRDLLREHGVRPGDAVGIASGRSAATAAAVLGVWAAGAHHVPLDPARPATRLVEELATTGARVVLGGPLPEEVRSATVLPVPGPAAESGDLWDGDLCDGGPPDPDATAYVIFTSGSTGRPKAVAVTHANLAALLADFTARLGPGPVSVLWSTAVTFDISALELLLPLCTGGTVVVADADAVRDPRALLDLVREHDVDVVQATPTAWRLIVPEATDELAGRTVLCGGEPMPASLARRLRELAGRVVNVYGPTETTIWSTAAELTTDPADPVPVGSPIAGTRVFAVDGRGQELPPGVPGELCIAGAGVARGYHGEPELTAARFGVHPRHGRFYRTGDVARLRHDGVLELAGRTDRQIKLRGHRIELGEVEAVLGEHPDVVVAAVVLHGDPQGDGGLLAAVVPRSGTDRAGLPDRLWAFAAQRLPAHAVPGAVVVVDAVPTTSSGKVDHARLARLTAPAAVPAAPAATGLASRLVPLFADVLGRADVDTGTNFFLHGGHSVTATRLARRIGEETGLAVAAPVVFAHPTPAALAAHLGRNGEAT